MTSGDRADELLKKVVLDPEDGALANDLLDLFHGGFPIINLRPLLSSANDGVARTGTWLASELGERCRPVLEDICGLLRHSDRRVRYFAIDCLMSAPPTNIEPVVEVIGLLRDRDAAVRLKAMEFVAGAPAESLQALIPHLSDENFELGHVAGTRLLLDRHPTPEEIQAFIESEDPVRRKYGAAAAARFIEVDETPINVACNSTDEDVRQFAEDLLSLRRS